MATFRVTSHSSRSLRQKSLGLFARKAFGSNTFDYAFFDNRPYTQYSSLLLRSTNSDHRSCRMRDAVLGEISEGLGLYYQAAQPIVVYLNGEYFGHYNLREKANKDSLAQWAGVTDPAAIRACDILERTGTLDSNVLHGSNQDWVELMNFVKSHDLNDPSNLQYVTDRLDVDSLFNYVIFNMIIGNYDVTNVRMYRFPGGKWTFFLHDIEAGCMSFDESPVDIFLRGKNARQRAFPIGCWPRCWKCLNTRIIFCAARLKSSKAISCSSCRWSRYSINTSIPSVSCCRGTSRSSPALPSRIGQPM